MKYLRLLSIPQRLWSQLAVVLLGFLVLLFVGLNQLHTALQANKVENSRQLVEVAYSIVERQYALMKEGSIDQSTAQQTAVTLIGQLRFDGGNYFWINDMLPRMIMHPTNAALNGKDISDISDPNGKHLFVDMVNVVKKDGEGMVPYMWPLPGKTEPAAKISYVKGFAPWGWIVGSGTYIQDVDTAYWSAAPTQIFIGVFTVLLVGVIAWLVGKSISGPISDVAAALDDIATGDGDLTKRLPDAGYDELSRLAGSFNSFSQKIQDILLKVEHAIAELTATSSQESSLMGECQQSIAVQQQEAAAVVRAMSEMAATVNNIAANAEQAAVSAQEADEQAVSGRKGVEQALESVHSLADEVKAASTVINQLALDSQSISGVLDVIRGVAEQTNLLALNAAIEAARAGEQGRGFAVVADEVRSLAAKTQQSTEEIRAMIEALQTGSRNAVQAMKNGEAAADKAVGEASHTTQLLASISNAINVISDMNAQIASASEEQSQVAHDINHSVGVISDMTDKSHTHINEAAASGNRLTLLSKELSALLAQFRL